MAETNGHNGTPAAQRRPRGNGNGSGNGGKAR